MFEKIGLKCIDSYEYYGVINDVYITLSLSSLNNSNSYLISTVFANNSKVGALLDFLSTKKENNAINILNFSISNDVLLINLSDSCDEKFIEDFLLETTQKIRQSNINNVCSHCQKTESLGFYKYNQGISVMCSDCGEQLISQIDYNQNSDSNYIQGFFGSLIGAFIGSLLWILLGIIGFYASAAGYVIALGAFTGYKFFKGKNTTTGVVINIVTILIIFLAANYFTLFFQLRKELEGFTFKDFNMCIPIFIHDPEVVRELIINFLLGLLFIVLGSYKTIQSYFQNAKILKEANVKKLS